ncbi:hypothetical protein M3Y97_00715200 [Aphelenchoides bicaudatus]|nr:hypothetical protein M3Y97_00715200 [Aphelenchoides bicaudatus]
MRKASISTNITRTARKFSCALVPQFIKLEPINALSKRTKLLLRISDIEQLQTALKQYVLHNAGHFDPVEFEVVDEQNDIVILTAQFQPEEFIVYEGTKQVLSIFLAEADPDADEFTVCKLRHPLSGIKIYEMVHTPNKKSCYITNCIDETTKCQLQTHSTCWRQMLSLCGFMFTQTYWTADQEGVNIGKVIPDGAFFAENSMKVEWCDEADMELRTLIVCSGLVLMIKEAFPALLHIIKQNKGQQT